MKTVDWLKRRIELKEQYREILKEEIQQLHDELAIYDPFLDSDITPYIGEAVIDMSKFPNYERRETWI